MQKESTLDLFRRAILSGICISIGGTVFLSCGNKYVGAFLFTLGLFAIVTRGMALYTGMVGYLSQKENQNWNYIKQLLVVLAGNGVGTAASGYALRFTRRAVLAEEAAELCKVKTDDSMLSLFLLAVGCGILMFLAVDGYKRLDDAVFKLVGVFLCIVVFIMSGFEHSIADIFYFSAAGAWSMHSLMCLIVVVLGNAVGGNIIPIIQPKKK